MDSTARATEKDTPGSACPTRATERSSFTLWRSRDANGTGAVFREHPPERYLSVKREAAASTKDWDTYTTHKAGVVAAILKSAEGPTSADRRPGGGSFTGQLS